VPRTPPFEGRVRVTKERLSEREDGAGPNTSLCIDPPCREQTDIAKPHICQKGEHLVFDHVRQGTDEEQFT